MLTALDGAAGRWFALAAPMDADHPNAKALASALVARGFDSSDRPRIVIDTTWRCTIS